VCIFLSFTHTIYTLFTHEIEKEEFLREISRNTIGVLVIVSLQSTTQIY